MVFVFGAICIDRLRRVPSLPPVGGYVEITSEQLMLGGEAANTATALHAWNHPVLLAGNSLGEGPDGLQLMDLVEAKGLPTDLLRSLPGTTVPVCDVYLTPDGERTMFGRGFASSGPGVPLDDLPFGQAQWFTAEPNMEKPSRDAVLLAHKAGRRIYLMDFLREDDPVMPGSFWQCSTDWAGRRGDVQRNVAWVRDWIAKYGCTAILSDGPNGFVAGSPDHRVRHYPPFPASSVVDTTGAGDMFRAGMLHGLDLGWPLSDCLRFASAAGCLKCAHLGATSQAPTEFEVHDLIRSCPEVSERYG